MRGGKRQGAGRKPGVPNKITSVARSAFLMTFNNLEGELEGWIRKTAEGIEVPLIRKDGTQVLDGTGKPVMVRERADPARAAEIMARMAEYHFPKLGRHEVTGKDGGDVVIQIVKYTGD